MEKATTQSEIPICYCCDKKINSVLKEVRALFGKTLCRDCEEQFVRTKQPKYRPNRNLMKYVHKVEKGVITAPYKSTIKLKNGIKITGPALLAEVGPLR